MKRCSTSLVISDENHNGVQLDWQVKNSENVKTLGKMWSKREVLVKEYVAVSTLESNLEVYIEVEDAHALGPPNSTPR